jgi:aspartyl-tRNA(Asn)/glutamyl-tRNA(Gln) amidotransferase subunit A
VPHSGRILRVVGYKPTKSRISTEGTFPFSYTFDSVGPLANSVAECVAADAVLAGEDSWRLEAASLQALRLGLPQSFPLRDLDETVSARFSEALATLSRIGVRLSDEPMPLLDEMVRANARGTIPTIESFAVHGQRLAERGGDFDPYARARIETGRNIPAADYISLMRARANLVRAMDMHLSQLDALVLPTTPRVAPTLVEVLDPRVEASLANDVVPRNTRLANFFDLCAISLPLTRNGGLPVGLMLVARNGQDRKLFRIASAVERLFAT